MLEYHNLPLHIQVELAEGEDILEAGIKVNPYNMEEIASGYQQLIDRNEHLKEHTIEQLERFDPYASCETFMNVLGINYKRL